MKRSGGSYLFQFSVRFFGLVFGHDKTVCGEKELVKGKYARASASGIVEIGRAETCRVLGAGTELVPRADKEFYI